MTFDASAFPVTLARESATPYWEADVIRTGTGHEQRNAPWSDALWKIEAATPTLTLAQYRSIYRHFNARRGMVRGFYLTLRTSYTTTTEGFGTGDGSTTAFQLIVNEGDSANAYNREIYKPVSGTVLIYDNASLKTETTHYTIDYATGIVTFLVAPVNTHALTWTGEFRIPVRYDVKELPKPELMLWTSGSTGIVSGVSIPLCEIRDYS
jgi:uncharacterized protein (TIGR02217 family)